VVAAINQAGTSSDSASGQHTPVAAGNFACLVGLIVTWCKGDAAGSSIFSDSQRKHFYCEAAGGNIGGVSDALGFAYQEVAGDFVITAA